MRNPFNAIRRCEELAKENTALKVELRSFETTKILLEEKCSEVQWLQLEVANLRKIVDEGSTPEKDEFIKNQENRINKLSEQLKSSEQGRERAVKKLCAANKENKQLLAVNERLAEFLHRSAFKSTISQEEGGEQ